MRKPIPPVETHLVEIPDPDFEPGDKVKVQGSRGKFVFRCRRRNVKTSEEWLEVSGGLPTRPSAMRSFRPELVSLDKRK